MKRTNKYLSLALAIIMALSLCVTSFAADITVANAAEGETYNAYKIFDYTKSGDAFSYTIDEYITAEGLQVANPWFAIVNAYTKDTVKIFTLTPSATDSNVYVVTYAKDSVDAAHFANYLSTSLKAANPAIVADDTTVATAEGANFGELANGYWFVDTTLGSLCSLVNANASQTLYEKNSIPTLTKEVQEDSTQAWGATATADKGQDVNFKLTVNTGSNENNPTDSGNGVDADYVITDTLPAGMTYNNDIAITGWAAADFTAAYVGDVLTITLKADKIKNLGENADIIITYSAKMDSDATVAGEGNKNTAILEYKEQTTTEVSATVYTYEFNVFKYTGEKAETGTALANAKFVLKNADQTKYAVATKEGDVYTITGWTTSLNGEAATEGKEAVPAATVFVSPDVTGKFNIEGLDVDTYYLEEIEAPAGYNLLTEDVKVELTADNTNSQIDVQNLSGAILPGTGGVGTTMFYVLGSVMMIGAAILLVTKKKMANEQ